MNTAVEAFDVAPTNHAISRIGMPGITSSQSSRLRPLTTGESWYFATTYAPTMTAPPTANRPMTAQFSTLEAN